MGVYVLFFRGRLDRGPGERGKNFHLTICAKMYSSSELRNEGGDLARNRRQFEVRYFLFLLGAVYGEAGERRKVPFAFSSRAMESFGQSAKGGRMG